MALTCCALGWVVLVLSLGLPVQSAVKVTQPYKVVSTNGTTQVHCFIRPGSPFHRVQRSSNQHLEDPFPDPEDLQVTLLKGLHGSQRFCSATFNLDGRTERRRNEREVQCEAQVVDGAVEVMMSGLRATDTDIYRCEVQIYYPPPYLRLTGNGTLIHVAERSDCPNQEAQRQHHDEEEEEEEEEITGPDNVLVMILVILIIGVVLIMIYFQTLQCEWGRTEVVRTPPTVLLQKTEALPFSTERMV